MRTLVFGGSGQVATELQRLPGVVSLDRAAADLTDPAACAAAIADCDADIVVNAAAYTHVDRAEDEEDLATRINGTAPGAMARAAAMRSLPFVHLSTDYVFDGSGTDPWRERHSPAPLGAYGRSKLAGELAVRAAGGTAVILRTSWVFSAHGANFVKTMLRLGRDRDRLTIVADQVGGPTPARDIAATCLAVGRQLHDGAGAPGIYHYSGAPDVSWADFARAIFDMAGLTVTVGDIPSAEYPTPARRPANSRLDCAALASEFGVGRPDWRRGLRDVLNELMA